MNHGNSVSAVPRFYVVVDRIGVIGALGMFAVAALWVVVDRDPIEGAGYGLVGILVAAMLLGSLVIRPRNPFGWTAILRIVFCLMISAAVAGQWEFSGAGFFVAVAAAMLFVVLVMWTVLRAETSRPRQTGVFD